MIHFVGIWRKILLDNEAIGHNWVYLSVQQALEQKVVLFVVFNDPWYFDVTQRLLGIVNRDIGLGEEVVEEMRLAIDQITIDQIPFLAQTKLDIVARRLSDEQIILVIVAVDERLVDQADDVLAR